MNNETLELILRMRDQATAVWKKVEGGIRGGVQKLGGIITKNWATIGVGIAGAFYVAMNALEKVDRAAKKVEKALKDSGGVAGETAQALQNVAKYASLTRQFVDELIIRGSIFAVGIGNAVATFFAALYTTIAFVLQKIVGALASVAEYASIAFLTLSPSLSAQLAEAAVKLRGFEKDTGAFVDAGVEHIKRYSKETTDALSATFASREALGLNLLEEANTFFEQHSRQIQKIAQVDLPTLSKAYVDTGQKLHRVAIENQITLDTIVEQMVRKNEEMASTYAETLNNIVGALSGGIHSAFAGEAAAGKTFLKGLLLGFIDMVQGMLIAAKAAAFAKSVLSFGATLAADLPFLLGATLILQTARAIVSSFHEGGSAFINAPPSQEVPIMVRGQETVRVTTPEQERSAGRGATINIYLPFAPDASLLLSMKRVLQEGLRRTGMTIDQFIVGEQASVTLR